MKTALYLCGLPPQNLQPQSNYKKNIRQILIKTFEKTSDQYSQNCQGHKNQGKSEKLSQPRGA